MRDDLNNLNRILEQATAIEDVPEVDLDPEARSLRKAWLDFGRLLEAGKPSEEIPHDRWVAPRPSRARRRLLASGALVAASLLIGVAMTWILRDTDRSERSFSPVVEKAAAINPSGTTLVQQQRPTTSASNELPWDDSLDEQIAQVGWEMIYAQQDVNDAGGLIQYGIEQMQKELEENSL